MMVRTIQHPGVEIQESEIGGYRSTVVMNNAYIMGFTDKGPIYDYSFITTTKEFTKIYGEPQTEAEKYVFIAVQSILANGGTPIIARMPYDNKQCKAYKALKMTWIDKTDMISPKIDTDLATPLIPLSTITDGIKKDKDFRDIFNSNNITIDNIPASGIDTVVNNITVLQAVELLNPYKSGNPISNGVIYDEIKDLLTLRINGVAPSSLNIDQAAVKSIVDSLKYDNAEAEIYLPKYNAGYDKIKYETSAQIESSFLSSKDNCYGVFSNKFMKVVETSGEITQNEYLISLFKDYEPDVKISGYDVINSNRLGTTKYHDEYKVLANLTGVIPNSGSGNVWYMSSFLKPGEKGSKYGYFDFDNYNNISGLLKANLTGEISGTRHDDDSINITVSIIDDSPIGYYDFGSTSEFIITPYVDDLRVYNVYDFNENKDEIKDLLTNLKVADDEGVIESNYKNLFENIPSENPDGLHSSNNKIIPLTASMTIDNIIPIYTETINGIISGTCEKITFERIAEDRENDSPKYKLLGFVNISIESPAVYGTILSSGLDPSYLSAVGWELDKKGNPKLESYPLFNSNAFNPDDATNISEYFNTNIKTGTYAFKFSTYADELVTTANVVFDKFYKTTYNAKLKNLGIVSVSSGTMLKNEQLVQLNAIYNDPAFMNLDEDTYTLLESKLLYTPEMGFKIGLYLDSEDCEISNDQYDDLVTVNQFKAVDRTIDKYGQDIDDANFIIVDKQKSVVQGVGGNIGFFTTIIDPFDALKVQRTLVSPEEIDASVKEVAGKKFYFDHSDSNIKNLDYWAYQSQEAWNTIYDDILNSMDCLQRVRNADGLYVGEPKPTPDEKINILDSWSIPLTGKYYDDSVSKTLMKKFPAISMADVTSEDLENPDYIPSIIDHQFATHVCVAVCKTAVDQSNGRIAVNIVETFFGSLFAEKNSQNGRSLFIGDIINANSDYIEFYRNDYVSAGDKGAYDPPEYRRTDVNQIFIKDSDELRNAAAMRGIDYEDYGCEALDPAEKAKNEANYYNDLHKYHIWEINKQDVCIYNLHWEANFTSFSKKESQKVIANTVGLYSVNDGTTTNIANNFLIDMDRCIKFIKNIDELPLHFICDAGLSTVAQFCDNVVWNPKKKSVVGEKTDEFTGKKTGVKLYEQTGGWITQPFDPDNDPDGEDRYITGYEDVSTWRKVVEKTISIAADIRKDCFVIIDAPRHLTLDGAAPKIRRSKFTNDFDKTIGKALRYISGINTSYAAGYYNWLRTTDVYTGRSMWIPPTTKIIGNYCYLNISNLPWLAPAGLTYGLISGCHGVSHNPDAQEEDQIYMKSWNYIKQYPFDGLVVEGQRTLLGKESVFERVNVRLLFLDLERYAYNVSRQFKYQVNNAYTREQFVATLKPKFEDYALRGGIYEYLIKVDEENNTPETIDANELRGDIFIKPARLIEFILLSFVGTSSGTDFTELSLNY